MNDGGFVAFFLATMLKEHFHTKSGMARILGLHLRTVQEAFKNIGKQKGASLVFINSICYCYNNAISVDAIYAQFIASAEKRGDILSCLCKSLSHFLIQKEPLPSRQRFCSLYKIFHIPSFCVFT